MKNRTLSIIWSIAFVLTFGIFSFFLYNTRVIPEIKVIIAEKTMEEKQSKSANPDLKKIIEILSHLQDRSSMPNLIQVFEREREHYVLLLTVLTGLATIMGIFFAISRLVEKNELSAIKQEFALLKEQYQSEITQLRRANIGSYLEYLRNKYVGQPLFFLRKNQVANRADYILYIQIDIARMARRFKPYLPGILSDDRHAIGNVIANMLVYAQKSEYEKEIIWDVEKSEVFLGIVNEFFKALSPIDFEIIKKELDNTRTHPINWGR